MLELLWQEARKKQLVATDEDVDKALQRIRANFPGGEDFDLKLRKVLSEREQNSVNAGLSL